MIFQVIFPVEAEKCVHSNPLNTETCKTGLCLLENSFWLQLRPCKCSLKLRLAITMAAAEKFFASPVKLFFQSFVGFEFGQKSEDVLTSLLYATSGQENSLNVTYERTNEEHLH